MDMGPMGSYDFLRYGKEGGVLLGAMMGKPPHVPVSAWSFYFRVPDIDAAVATVTAKGGQILRGPQEIPGGDFTINGIDPQGAHFAMSAANHKGEPQ